MPVASTDIKFKLSGGAANANALLSLGGVKSSVDAPAGLFDRVEPEESSAGDIECRIIYIHNAHATESLVGAVAWFSGNTPSASSILEMGLGTSAVNGVEQALANESAAPVGVTFSSPASKSTGVALGTIPAGQSRALVLRRTVAAGAAGLASDTYKIKVEGE